MKHLILRWHIFLHKLRFVNPMTLGDLTLKLEAIRLDLCLMKHLSVCFV